MMGYGYGEWGWGAWLTMILTMVAVWGLIVGLVVWVVRGDRPVPARDTSDEQPAVSAEGILAGRYARGEIDEDEFHRRQKTLTGNGAVVNRGR